MAAAQQSGQDGGGGIGLVYWHLFRKYGGLSMNRATAG